MKIFQLVESANNAAQLKTAFDDTQWRNIVHYFLNQRGTTGYSGLGLENNIEQALEKIGPGMDNTTTADDWNAKASRFGAQIDSTTPTWPAIFNHLAAAERTAPPAPPRAPGLRTDVDVTDESPEQVAAWAQGPATMNREQLRAYYDAWTRALATHRSADYMRYINADTRFRQRLFDVQAEVYPAEGETVAKTEVDHVLYAWLTSVDQSLLRPGAMQRN
jgi:hypothetical protein